MKLKWRATAPGLLYEAYGDNYRRYVIAHDGKTWLLDLFLDFPYATEQQTDPQPAPSLDAAQQMAQDWESELY